MPTVRFRLSDRAEGNAHFTLPPIAPRVRGGLYVGGNGDPTGTLPAPGMIVQYHSMAEPGPSQYPGHNRPWIPAAVTAGALLNLVLELKVYGATAAAQTFTVEGRPYTVPAPNGTIQRRPGTAAAVAYSYAQVTSGACDGLIHRTLAALRTIPPGAWVNVQLASEVDTDNEYGTTHNGTTHDRVTSDARAVAAYSYIIGWLRDPPTGIPPAPVGVTFTIGWAGQWSGREAYLRCHPDTLPVDYDAYNAYNHNAAWSPAARLRETLAYKRAAGPIMRRLPILMAEWGTNATFPGGQAAYIDAWPHALAEVNREQVARREGPYLATCYFSSRDTTWGLLAPADTGGAALRRCYQHPIYGRRP